MVFFHLQEEEKAVLLSNMLRRILYHTSDTKVIIFDISSEYPFFLMDVFADPNIQSKLIMESPIKNIDKFYISVVKPREFEEDEKVKDGLARDLRQRYSYILCKTRIRNTQIFFYSR